MPAKLENCDRIFSGNRVVFCKIIITISVKKMRSYLCTDSYRSKKNTDLVQQVKINVSLLAPFGVISSFTNSFRFLFLAPVVQKVDNTIHWINP